MLSSLGYPFQGRITVSVASGFCLPSICIVSVKTGLSKAASRPEFGTATELPMEIWFRKTTVLLPPASEKLVGLPSRFLAGSLADVVEETPRVFNGFFLARAVEEGIAAEDLFSLDERAVGDRDLAAGSFVHADACVPKVTPSHSSSHPAFMPSAMSLPMDAISASVGRRLAGLCVKMLMKRMSILLGCCFAITAILSNGTEANRHETEIFSVRTTIAAISTVSMAPRCLHSIKMSEAGEASTGGAISYDGLAPHSSASFISVASSTQKPPMCSLVSRYGPSSGKSRPTRPARTPGPAAASVERPRSRRPSSAGAIATRPGE